MRYFVPDLQLGAFLPEPKQFVEQYGGVPWGLPVERWPICAECGEPMTMLAQFQHHPERLPLGKEGRVLYLFQCESMQGCATWEAESGANAVIILEPEQIQDHLTLPPSEKTWILPEARVVKWNAKDDGVPVDWQEHFLDGDMYHQWYIDGDLPEGLETTKLGGFPEWVQWPEGYPKPYYFAGQFDSGLTVEIPEGDKQLAEQEKNGYRFYEVSPEIGQPFVVYIIENEKTGERKYNVEFASFGDTGIGYLFVNPDPHQPAGKFLWQCT
ncbi:hypothetical protein [Thermoflavimicrobium dichotomicum]|uniref:DUF1963 domain-containing protein n=1 Tax=Thermoflavimicrobium dichotomicum TaxID=46223 RepID=A0A1I3MGY0_9BACL|nr:hypothetical protein [Thermoflavimicrobium dichotomicum]SFI96030.1 hypothetical protein SAMN05421852_10358 [Thermoflavimicrobium dichotomicum]